ncbi:MAG: mechanosensitive ion channel family protein, partial [Ginsengibacter sp.]
MKFLDQVYFDNTLRSYLAVAISILLALILKRIISRYATSLLFRLIKHQTGTIDKRTFDSLIIVPLERVLVVLISIFAIDRFNFPHQLNIT